MAHLSCIGFSAIAGDDHFVWIAEDDPIQALLVFAAKGDHLVEIRTRQQDFRIRDMKDFADSTRRWTISPRPRFLTGNGMTSGMVRSPS